MSYHVDPRLPAIPECPRCEGATSAAHTLCDRCAARCGACGEDLTLAGDCESCGLASLDGLIAARGAADVAHQVYTPRHIRARSSNRLASLAKVLVRVAS